MLLISDIEQQAVGQSRIVLTDCRRRKLVTSNVQCFLKPVALSIRLERPRRTQKHSSPEFCVANLLNSGSPIPGRVRVCFFVSFAKTPSTYMGVNLRRCQAFVAQQFLHTS